MKGVIDQDIANRNKHKSYIHSVHCISFLRQEQDKKVSNIEYQDEEYSSILHKVMTSDGIINASLRTLDPQYTSEPILFQTRYSNLWRQWMTSKLVWSALMDMPNYILPEEFLQDTAKEHSSFPKFEFKIKIGGEEPIVYIAILWLYFGLVWYLSYNDHLWTMVPLPSNEHCSLLFASYLWDHSNL